MNANKLLSGAEVFAKILEKEGVRFVFAYPGTSELAMCDAILSSTKIELINGRGDKESAFMAAGGCLLQPARAVAILHGARGLTNAAGAIADAKRNEIGTVFFVGLPSTASQEYLPPHGEKKLIENVGNFVKYFDEIKEQTFTKSNKKSQEKNAQIFIEKIKNAIIQSRTLPRGPVLLGIPQNISESRWIPESALVKSQSVQQNKQTFSSLILSKLHKSIALVQNSRKPIIFVDDFLFKNQKTKQELLHFAQCIHAPIFQVQYSRGPMMFESLSYKYNSQFIGFYNPQSIQHKKLLFEADLLITLEDRNMYPRVVGKLPECQKIVLTSNPEMTQKNKYLKSQDILIFSDVLLSMQYMRIKCIPNKRNNSFNKHWLEVRNITRKGKPEVNKKYNFMRKSIVQVFADEVSKEKNPILVDDSQMFGGILVENYEEYPEKLRVFGDHGAFIGGGLAIATGLARCEPEHTVFVTLGDQSFTNALQGLVSAAEGRVNIKYVVCNNGKSVSLMKQILSQDSMAFEKGKSTFLLNAPFDYSKCAKSLGIFAITHDFLRCNKSNEKLLLKQFRNSLKKAVNIKGPMLIELKLPSDPLAWKGIWNIIGNEK